MNIISHRGNIDGPIPERENAPSYIDTAIQLGYDVEVDVRLINNNEIWLGHDAPQYRLEMSWIEKRQNKLWFHCKDVASAMKFSELLNLIFFCHSQDPYVLTSNGYLWIHDMTVSPTNKCIVPFIDGSGRPQNNAAPYGICTDFVLNYR